MIDIAHLLANLPGASSDEQFTQLLHGGAFRLVRIVSTGQATPPGEWYDQDDEEWVLVVAGAARLRIEGQAEPLCLGPGDYVQVPAHVRHRVEWTDPGQATVWLALHYQAPDAG
jgi:cupin 2 domain-containing protein